MRFQDGTKPMPELVASKDERSRPVLTKVHLDAERSQIVATDSYILARIPVELDEGDTSGPIPVEALKAARKPPTKYGGDVHISANGDVQVRQENGEPYLTVPREPNDYQFPDADRLFPENLATFEIGLSAERLLALAKGLGADKGSGYGVRLRFTANADGEPSPLRPIVVKPLNGYGDADGILMPIRIAR